MYISWLDTKDATTSDILYDSCQMARSFESYSESADKECFNIIVSDRRLANSLLRAFSKLENNFPTLALRFGWINSEKKDEIRMNIPVGNSIVVGEDSHIRGYKEVPNVKSLLISSKATDNNRHLGYQRHFAAHHNPASISLGELKADRSDAETAVRSAEALCFHIDALRAEDSNSIHSHTTGLDIYESCHLMRLAGLSKKLGLVCINTVSSDITDRTADAIALLIWYFLEGQINNEIETMKQKENDIFLVSSDLFEEPIKFVVGHKTGRWWYQHPSTKEYLPCSDKDYKAISMGNLPDAIVSLQYA